MSPTGASRVLIVEDDEGTAILQATRLRRLGYIVHTSQTPGEVFAIVATNVFDLIILDYRLDEEMTGISLYLVLQERGVRIPAILVTGFEDPRVIVQAMRAGIRDFVPKTAEYLDDLPTTAARVIRQATLEREAAETGLVREKQELLEAAFDAAKLVSFVWNLRTNEFRWSGKLEQLFGVLGAEKLNNFSSLIDIVVEEDRKSISLARENSATDRLPFDVQFRVNRSDGHVRWIQAKGRHFYAEDGTPERLVCVMNDATHEKLVEVERLRVSQQIQSLNERLQLSVVETHHRVKNSLQNVLSLLNLQLRKDSPISEEEIRKLGTHIQGIASLHEVLVEQAKEEGDTSHVGLDQVCSRVLAVLKRAAGGRAFQEQLESCQGSPRQASSIAVILNELVSNCFKYGNGGIRVSLRNEGPLGVLEVQNDGSSFPDPDAIVQSKRTGLTLVKLLAQADLECDPVFENLEGGKARVTLRFPLS